MNKKPNIPRITGCVSPLIARMKLSGAVSESELASVVENLLFGPRAIWEIYETGILTEEETALLLVSRVASWLVTRSGLSWGEHGWMDADPRMVEDVRLALDDG